MSTDVMNIPTGTSNSDDLSSDQRVGNEVELRELIYQSLERDGLILRLKAQLRAAVFKTIEKSTNSIGTNSHVPTYDGMNGRICRGLVLDWLKHASLLYTEDVFKVETTGPNHPAPLTHTELLEQLHIKSNHNESQPILHALLDHSTNRSVSTINSLPDHIKQSIDNQFLTEKINDLNRVRDHFRSLFSSAFDSSVLDVFINKNISSTLSTLPKHQYEQICLKWMQACANALIPQSTPAKQIPFATLTQSTLAQSTINSSQMTTRTYRSTSPPAQSLSSSSSVSSSSDNQQKPAFNFQLPTTMPANKSVIKKATDVIPPLINFDDNDSNEDDNDDEDTSASIFSKRNATPAALNHLKNIDNIIQGDETPRTRTTLQKPSNHGTKDLPIEYDDESMSQSVSHSIISSVDDVTVDKASPSPSAQIDFYDDLDTN